MRDDLILDLGFSQTHRGLPSALPNRMLDHLSAIESESEVNQREEEEEKDWKEKCKLYQCLSALTCQTRAKTTGESPACAENMPESPACLGVGSRIYIHRRV